MPGICKYYSFLLLGPIELVKNEQDMQVAKVPNNYRTNKLIMKLFWSRKEKTIFNECNIKKMHFLKKGT